MKLLRGKQYHLYLIWVTKFDPKHRNKNVKKTTDKIILWLKSKKSWKSRNSKKKKNAFFIKSWQKYFLNETRLQVKTENYVYSLSIPYDKNWNRMYFLKPHRKFIGIRLVLTWRDNGKIFWNLRGWLKEII